MKIRLIVLYIFIFFSISPTFSQKKKSTKMVSLEQSDSSQTAASFNVFKFKNLNKIPYYYEAKKFEQLKKLDQKQSYEKLYQELRDYVSNFGVQNFYRDTYLLWRLAKLTELFGEFQDAVQLYKLVLKHHRDDIDINKIELYYDSIARDRKDLYVPLDYYYELVEYRKEVDTLRPPRGVLLNMGKLVNSGYSDYGPALSANDDLMIFTSKRNTVIKGFDKVSNEDLFLSKRWGEFWDEAQPLESINSQYNEGSACISRDGKTIYFSRCHAPDCYGNCDIFSAELQADSTWGHVKNLGINVNSKSWDSHPSLSHTEDTLYFASDRIGGFGLADIYFTYKLKNGEWATAQNAGPMINTRKNEVSPFYHPEYDILYFSSNGQLLNFGEFDIFKSYRRGSYWTDPKNIGPLVNGPGSEFYFTIDSKSWYLFYAKSAKDNMENLDLYSFPLPMEAQPLATTKVSGSLMDSISGKPFKAGIVSIIDLDNGIEVAPKFLRDDGTFEFNLINNKNYLLIIQGEEFFRIEELFYLDGDMEFKRFSQPISSKIKFESVEFENGKSELRTEMFGDMYKVADFLMDNPDFKLKISGHTDSDGSQDLNLQLSQERAQAIKDFIVNFGGVPESRIESQGFGSSKPIVEEKTEEDKRLNRRVEFEIYRPAQDELQEMQEEIKQEADGWN
ncbi:MAG: OmpA family protein [Candidatus Cyclobacteriaceae bacterium M3_2C_046]